jgi:hypothetical protein
MWRQFDALIGHGSCPPPESVVLVMSLVDDDVAECWQDVRAELHHPVRVGR